MSYITEDFLLSSQKSKDLYHGYAADQPIIDYHCHLPPQDLAENRRFKNLYEIWLEGDHYKWRAMRTCGFEESLCTGDAPPKEKFLAWAKTVPQTLRNPLHHWTHLELKRYFGIEELLSEDNADEIWSKTEEMLATDQLSVWGILKQFKVKAIGTTDDPTDSLEHHKAAAKSDCPAEVVPTFRPDPVFKSHLPDVWNDWVDRLEKASGQSCGSLADLKDALSQRIEFFASLGCRASDHGLERIPDVSCAKSEAERIFGKARSRQTVSVEEAEKLAGHLLLFLGESYAKQGWAMQFHLGALRNVNDKVFQTLGPDKGCDTIGDFEQGRPLAKFLGALEGEGMLPKTILYNLNPRDNYLFASMVGNFFEPGLPGKMQFGSGWWFLDQIEGMTWQINALSNLGLLSQFIGMLTDSRSFMSFPRHEYFRRLLCDLIGKDIEAGLLPDDHKSLGQMVANISYHNAARYFGF